MATESKNARTPASPQFSDSKYVSASNLEERYFAHWPESFQAASQWVESIRDAVVPLNSVNAGKHCASVIISRSGYALTAQHCIPQNAKNLDHFSYARGFETATVILKGSDSTFFDGAHRFPTRYSPGSDAQAYRSGYFDWALVKFPDSPKAYTCVPIEKAHRVREPILHLGFADIRNSQVTLNSWLLLRSPYGITESALPREFIELDKKIYTGINSALAAGEPWAIRIALPLIATTGFSYANGADASQRGAYFFAGGGYTPEGIDSVLYPKSYFATSAPATDGMSGGPVLSASARTIVGITVLGNASAPYSVMGIPAGTYSVGSDVIVSEVVKELGDEKAGVIFDCPETP